MRARTAAMLGVAAAAAVGVVAFARRHDAGRPRAAVETTTSARLVRRDRVGLPEKKAVVREPARVRALIAALGIDQHGSAECPADYADADVGVVLGGNDVYARRNVYLFGLVGDGGADALSIVSVTSAGCRRGPAADPHALRRELEAARILD